MPALSGSAVCIVTVELLSSRAFASVLNSARESAPDIAFVSPTVCFALAFDCANVLKKPYAPRLLKSIDLINRSKAPLSYNSVICPTGSRYER